LSSSQSLAAICRILLLVPCASFVIPITFFAATITMGETSTFAGDDSGNGSLLLTQDATFSQSASAATQMAGIIPADRMTTWNPGLNAIGGIPNRTTIYRTLSPRGGSLDDTAAIQSALDTCPPGQVVKLSPGTFNINSGGLHFRRSDCTLRGSGTGALGSGNGGTRLIKADRDTNPSFAVLYVGNGVGQSSSINLAADAIKGTNSLTLVSNRGIRVGEIVLIDQVTDNDPRVWWGPQHNPPGGGSRRWFARQDRSLTQMMEVTAVKGNTITFSTPFHITFKVEYAAQLSRYANPVLHRVGIEDLYLYGGMGGDGHGNISVALCAYCWVKNIEAHWSIGTSVGFYATFRSVLRDSYIHETPDPNPGGAGYLVGLNYGASDNLIENNVIWNGNKNIVMRATGGGNVIAYNYMDDSYGATYPHAPEAGLNAGHYTTPHMELLEGNYSHNYKGDSFWGNSIYITVFRNWLSALRAAHPPLNTYAFTSGHCVYKYGDYGGRAAVDVQAYSYHTNFVGNILGMPNQQLLGYDSKSCFNSTEVGWTYENLHGFLSQNIVPMWNIGALQTRAGWQWVSNAYETQLRQGNWDWVTTKQTWHGIGGAAGSGTPQPIPNSLYLTAAPPFFGNNRWPWVDPATGATYTLPAKYCFEHNQMPTCLQNVSTTASEPLR
jgi:hypothetical protein